MAVIREFNIIEPPTSGELQHKAVRALSLGGLLRVVGIAQQEVPAAKPEVFEMRIAQTVHPEAGGMTVAGFTERGEHLTLRMPEDLAAPALASLITNDTSACA